MAQKPSIPSGTRDFSPTEMLLRNFIFETLRHVFQRYSYFPIETPAMENLSTLLGKYGEEGDKLLFKILNSGDFMSKADLSLANEPNRMALQLCEKGLRYDLTVPFARYVVQHQNDIVFPFKRYQMQPVWRADRPQKGRYREFYQCDVDIIGSNSLVNEVEIVQIIDDVFKLLNVNIIIKINNRKILNGIADSVGESDKFMDITVAIDKLDKIGIEKVNEELLSKGLSQNAVDALQPIVNLHGSTDEKFAVLAKQFETSEIGKKGLEELQTVFDYIKAMNINAEIEFDISLARGLSYYTGAIVEVKAKDMQIGSICGGGRYDDLTGIFGLPNVSGVGVSFGAERIYDVMEHLNLFPKESSVSTKILFINFGAKETKYCLPMLAEIRKAKCSAEMYPDAVKMKKQMEYADKRGIPYVAIVGETEIEEQKITLKNLKTGSQSKLSLYEVIDVLNSNFHIS